jgi:5'-phosphate synthase pdxT subunit
VRTYGVLALQGDWFAHGAVLDGLGAPTRPVRTAADLDLVDALVLPGGESSAMLRLMEPENLAPQIGRRIADGMPVLATCAGVILLAEKVEPPQTCLGALSVGVVRNAYGRQIHSTVDTIEVEPMLGSPATMEAVFIRAPRIVSLGAGADVLGRWRGDPVLVRQGRVVGATFHPELTGDHRVHELLLRIGEGRDG